MEILLGFGSKYIEILIMKNLYSQLDGVVWEWVKSKNKTKQNRADLTLIEYVKCVKKYFEDNKNSQQTMSILIEVDDILEEYR